MHDLDVRVALHDRLRATHARELHETRIIDELGISGIARVDTAVLNGSFTGYEIKSEKDRLSRLPNQISAYSSVLDYCYLVTTDRHLTHAHGLLPEWWGVMIATQGPEGVQLRRRRSPRINSNIDRLQLVKLLWRSEVIETLESLSLATGIRSRPNAVLWERLASGTSERALRKIVRETLKTRSGWRSDSRQQECAGV